MPDDSFTTTLILSEKFTLPYSQGPDIRVWTFFGDLDIILLKYILQSDVICIVTKHVNESYQLGNNKKENQTKDKALLDSNLASTEFCF